MKESKKNCRHCGGSGSTSVETTPKSTSSSHRFRGPAIRSSRKCSSCNGTGEISRADKKGSSIFSWIFFIAFMAFMAMTIEN